MLVENTLFGPVDKVERSILRIREWTTLMSAKGIRILGAFSGGKDSCVIKELCRMAGIEIDWFYNQVGLDPPELVAFIKEHHADVRRILPPVPFFRQMLVEGWPPLRQQRWCCRHLKEYHGDGLVIIGIRAAESSRRAKRLIFEPCKTNRERWFLSPILDWSDDDVWQFVRERKLPYCSLYDEGWTRIGCLFCPMNRDATKHGLRWPKMKNAWIVALGRMIKRRIATGKKCTFDSGAELFDWWTTRSAKGSSASDSQQCFKFDD